VLYLVEFHAPLRIQGKDKLLIADFRCLFTELGTDRLVLLANMLVGSLHPGQQFLLLMKTLRTVDTPARWEPDTLLIMLPVSSLEGASLMAQRIRAVIKKQGPGTNTGPITVSIGISEIEDKPDQAIAIAEQNLELASQDKGDAIVSGRQATRATGRGPGLSAYFKTSE